jgi:chromosome partitioning protein
MKTLSLAARKGGVGKSTISTSLAVAAALAGEKVALVDLDDQGSVRSWAKRREAKNILAEAVKPADLRPLLVRLKSAGVTLAIVDTPGITSPGVAVALQASDFVLIPMRPSLVDVETARATIDQLKTIRAPFGMVLSAALVNTPARTLDAAQAIATLGVVAPLVVHSRIDFVDAMAGGLGAAELNPDGKAAAEIAALWAWIKGRLNHG